MDLHTIITNPIFIIAGSTYLVALAIIHLLAPKLEPAPLGAPGVKS